LDSLERTRVTECPLSQCTLWNPDGCDWLQSSPGRQRRWVDPAGDWPRRAFSRDRRVPGSAVTGCNNL